MAEIVQPRPEDNLPKWLVKSMAKRVELPKLLRCHYDILDPAAKRAQLRVESYLDERVKRSIDSKGKSLVVMDELPHHGPRGPGCGQVIFQGHLAASGKTHYRKTEHRCGIFDCSHCGPEYDENGDISRPGAWEVDRARTFAEEWEGVMRRYYHNGKRPPLVQIVASPAPELWDELPIELRTERRRRALNERMNRAVKMAGFLGGPWFNHGHRVPSRWNDRKEVAESIHRHYVGMTRHRGGMVRGTAAIEAKLRVIVHRVTPEDDDWSEDRSMFGTCLYLASHASRPVYATGRVDLSSSLYLALGHNYRLGRACGRVGMMLGAAKHRLKVDHEGDKCPVCGDLVHPMDWFRLYRRGDGPPSSDFGVVDWNEWDNETSGAWAA